ncbi:hypothetical protein Trydic_g20977 [Trypoxylus dichotomus]
MGAETAAAASPPPTDGDEQLIRYSRVKPKEDIIPPSPPLFGRDSFIIKTILLTPGPASRGSYGRKRIFLAALARAASFVSNAHLLILRRRARGSVDSNEAKGRLKILFTLRRFLR